MTRNISLWVIQLRNPIDYKIVLFGQDSEIHTSEMTLPNLSRSSTYKRTTKKTGEGGIPALGLEPKFA